MRRAQSEALGFVFIFAIIITTTGIVYAGGYASLQDARDVERANNAERAFEVLADNLDDIVYRGAPSRGTEIKLSDAQLSLGEPTTISVEGERVDNPNENFSSEHEIRPVVYDVADTTIVYEWGAVIREEPRGTVMATEPRHVMSTEHTAFSVVQTRSRNKQSVSGSATVLVQTDRAGVQLLHASPEPYNLTVELTTPRAATWEEYLDSKQGVDCTRSGETVTCELEAVERSHVALVQLNVRFS